jgi:hypothetical protein
MAQLGHTDPAFTLRVYAHAMRRDEGDKERLKALVEGRAWAPVGTPDSTEASMLVDSAVAEDNETPADAAVSSREPERSQTRDLSLPPEAR